MQPIKKSQLINQAAHKHQATCIGHSRFRKLIVALSFLIPATALAQNNASLLPNAVQQFFDNNGKPLSAGKVDFYVPNSSARKPIWLDATKSTPLPNPVPLNAAGRPNGDQGIYGDGQYRQVLKDRNGVIIWDRLTSSAGAGGGGGGGGDGEAVGTMKMYAGFIAPTNYQFTYGQELSRTTYSALFTALTSIQAVFCTSGSPTLTGIGDTSQLSVGTKVEASCIPAGSQVISKTSNSVTINNNAITSTDTEALFFPWGNGNGSTTFNAPDFRGRAPVGRDNMGGVVAAVLTSQYFGTNPDALAAAGGSQSSTLVQANLPSVSPTFTGTPGGVTVNSTQNDFGRNPNSVAFAAGGVPFFDFLTPSTVTSTGTFTPVGTISALGSDAPFSNVQPSLTTNIIIKVTPDSGGGGGGSGSVTAFSFSDMNGFVGSVANPTTTPNLILSLSVSGMLKGFGGQMLTAAPCVDYQPLISLTTLGSAGAATFDCNTGVLNIPQYAGGGGSGGVTNPTLVSTTPYTPTNADTFLCVNVGGPATINLQSLGSRGNLNLGIVDCSGNASTNNISIVPNGSDVIAGIYNSGNPLKVTTDYGGWNILPIGTAWAIDPNDMSGSSSAIPAQAATLKGNPTATNGTMQDISIGALPNIGTPNPTDDKILIYDNANNVFKYVTPSNLGSGGTGTVTSVSVVSANGLAGSVATATTTPAITLSTSVTGVLKGNGTAISAAVNSDLPTMTATVGGAVPTPPNNTTDFLRGDGTWAAPVSGGTPGGSTTQLQYNNAGVFGGITGATTDGTTVTLVAPILGTPASVNLTNATNMPLGGITGFGTGVATALGVNVGSAGAPVLFDGALGTPSSGTLTNATGLPISGIAGLAAGVGTWLATPSSANLAAAVTDETGSGALVFGTNPAISGPTVTGGSIDNTPIGAGTRSTGAFTTLAANGAVTLSGIPGSGTIASSICATSGGALIAQAGANCYAGGSASAGGNNTNVQYNSSGVLAGTDGFVFDGTSQVSLGISGTNVGKVLFNNATSGSITLEPATGALGSTVLTLPAGSTTLIGAGTTATFTNKTFDTAGTGNNFLINGVAATANTGTGAVARAVSPAFTTPDLGTPSAVNLANATGLPLSGLSGLGANVATWLATPSSANLAAAITDETGSGALVFATSPSLVTPSLGVATATSINGNTFTSGSYTLTGVASKTLTFNNSITLAGTDSTTWTGPSSNATLAALNIASQTVTGGANVTSQSISTGSYTVDCGTRPLQYITNGGAFTLTAPANDGNCVLLVTNNGSAGAITFSGFSVGSNTGDALTTTNTSKFSIMVWRVNGTAAYQVVAHQ